MGIKYELIPTNEELSHQKNTTSKNASVKVFLICVLLLTVVLYYSSANSEEELILVTPKNAKLTTISGVNVISEPDDLIVESEELIPTTGPSEFRISSTTQQQNLETEVYSTHSSVISLLNESTISITPDSLLVRDPNYFVDSPQCKMSAPNPFTADVLKIWEKKSYSKCDKSSDSITVIYDKAKKIYQLHKNDPKSICCYRQILRAGARTMADQSYKLKKCIEFQQDFVVPRHVEEMITECRKKKKANIWQKDAFSFVHPNVKSLPATERRPSVLLWGIDSISRMNFQRTMPHMFEYLRGQHWFELQGYNKMADNTFPNLMAVLTGMNNTRSYDQCRPREVGGLDACPMLWKDFKNKGYATAYSEDWATYSTFDFRKRGFRNVPTDFYLRPLILALEKELKTVYAAGIPYCLGRRHSAEYVYNSAMQFTQVYKDQPTFGLFWTNSFSHNDFSMPSAMDDKMVEYMRQLDRNGVFENSIILFFSDHGMRFGPLRNLASGFLEERLPTMYIRLPKWFREKYQRFVTNLVLNQNRLTSPYDIYATLRHILELDTPSEQLPRPEGCPTCHSVFEEVSFARDCQKAGLEEHWCACEHMAEIAANDTTVRLIAEKLVDKINTFLASKNVSNLCEHLKLNEVRSAHRSADMKAYRVQFTVSLQNARLEASGSWNDSTQEISTKAYDISRLDFYKEYSKCIKDETAKKYCICVQ
ncbi:uncharacterized protein [Drosophila tropicalis]|uniref:uncharacterized protein n=1 Tax=Drosophila tropicalis TaxID=46794 RepID=UPI0035ABF250